MKKSILTVLILSGAFMALPDTASAQSAYDYPWCAYYSGRSGGSNCYFRTRGQCMTSVSGVGGICQPNPFYHAAQYPERPRTYRRVREY